ncbi:hypothetical protein GOP47_0017710 [Adiantum capillus-veneris]|uniref:Uncharacterized protein n=1 Tax=Adiantum capillus-veneris TaxID=13818 RepID=A0A9D4UGD0_ADICA|nr:hypothetical protein GOP47_0017710 [Adiantum capillus-veneris]
MWRCDQSTEEAERQYKFIQAWWAMSKVANGNLAPMDYWLIWKKDIIGYVDDRCSESIPRTNLSESRHASWLAGDSYKQKMYLYDTTISDIRNTLFH